MLTGEVGVEVLVNVEGGVVQGVGEFAHDCAGGGGIAVVGLSPGMSTSVAISGCDDPWSWSV